MFFRYLRATALAGSVTNLCVAHSLNMDLYRTIKYERPTPLPSVYSVKTHVVEPAIVGALVGPQIMLQIPLMIYDAIMDE